MIDAKRKIYLTGFIFAVLILILLFALLFPLLSTIKKDSLEFFSQKEKLVLIEKKKKDLFNLQKTYEVIQPDLVKIDSLFVEPKEPIEFINFLEKTAEKLNLPIEISLTGGAKETSAQDLFFQMKVSGSFANFMKFLEKLEAAPYLIEIENLIIKRVTASELGWGEIKTLKSSDIQATLDIKVQTK